MFVIIVMFLGVSLIVVVERRESRVRIGDSGLRGVDVGILVLV